MVPRDFSTAALRQISIFPFLCYLNVVVFHFFTQIGGLFDFTDENWRQTLQEVHVGKLGLNEKNETRICLVILTEIKYPYIGKSLVSEKNEKR